MSTLWKKEMILLPKSGFFLWRAMLLCTTSVGPSLKVNVTLAQSKKKCNLVLLVVGGNCCVSRDYTINQFLVHSPELLHIHKNQSLRSSLRNNELSKCLHSHSTSKNT